MGTETFKEEIWAFEEKYGVKQAVYAYSNPGFYDTVKRGFLLSGARMLRSVAPAWTSSVKGYGLDRAGEEAIDWALGVPGNYPGAFDEVITLGDDFNYRYWTAGSYQALFHLLHFCKVNPSTTRVPVLYCFEGDYEGAYHIAKQVGLVVEYVPRNRDPRGLVDKGVDYLYVSSPNAKDGRLVNPELLKAWSDAGAKIILDVAYLGMADGVVDATLPGIYAVLFSFSKWGYFNHRMGFAVVKEAVPSLFAVNEWFVSIPAVEVAKQVLAWYPRGIHAHRAAMQKQQLKAIAEIEKRTGLPLTASPVWLLALLDQSRLNVVDAESLHPGIRHFVRGVADNPEARFCLSPVFVWQDLNRDYD